MFMRLSLRLHRRFLSTPRTTTRLSHAPSASFSSSSPISAKKMAPFPEPKPFIADEDDTSSSAAAAPAADDTHPDEQRRKEQLLLEPPPPPKEDGGRGGDVTTLRVGESLRLDNLGPLVVNTDGTLSRVGNWAKMAEIEKKATLRVLGRRNQERLAALRAEGKEPIKEQEATTPGGGEEEGSGGKQE